MNNVNAIVYLFDWLKVKTFNGCTNIFPNTQKITLLTL